MPHKSQQVHVLREEAARLVQHLQRAHRFSVRAVQRHRQNGFRNIARFDIYTSQEPFIPRSVIHKNGLVARYAGPYQPLPDGDVQLLDTVRNLGPQSAILGVDQPNAAPVRSHQAARHAGIEQEQSIEIVRGADFGCVIEDDTGNSICWDHWLAEPIAYSLWHRTSPPLCLAIGADLFAGHA